MSQQQALERVRAITQQVNNNHKEQRGVALEEALWPAELRNKMERIRSRIFEVIGEFEDKLPPDELALITTFVLVALMIKDGMLPEAYLRLPID